MKLEQEMGRGDTVEVEKLREELRKERVAKREAETRMNAAERELLKSRARVAEEMGKVKVGRTELDKSKKEASSYKKKWEDGEVKTSLQKMQAMLERQVRLGERTWKLLHEDLAGCTCRQDGEKGRDEKAPKLKSRIATLENDLKSRWCPRCPWMEDIDMVCEEAILMV